MAKFAQTRITAARYDREGYVSARWTVDSDAVLVGFALIIRSERPGQIAQSTTYVEDGGTRTLAGMPFSCEQGTNYQLIVTPYDDKGPLSSSDPFPIEIAVQAELEPLEFTERLAYTPLLIDSGYNVVKVRLIAPDGTPRRNQPISWRIPPEYRKVLLETTKPTMTDNDGIAANRILVPGEAGVPDLLTVSAWCAPEGATSGSDHVSALFRCVEPRVFCSFAQTFAHPLRDTSEPGKPQEPDDDQLITATATLLDGKSQPIRGLRIALRMEPNAATLAYERVDAGTLPPLRRQLRWQDWPPYERGFPLRTDNDGQCTVMFANAASQIMVVCPTVNAIQHQYYSVFTEVDYGTGEASPGPRLPLSPGTDNVLDLNRYPDTVPIVLPTEIGITADGAIWLNDAIVAVAPIGSMPAPAAIPVLSEYFVPDDRRNRIGYVEGDRAGNGQDSVLVYFKASGQPSVPQPVGGGSLAEPRFEAGGVKIVNDSVVTGGLPLRIPAYKGIALGDAIQLRIYLDGYYQGTASPKHGLITLSHAVEKSDLAEGFVVILDEALLRGYAASAKGRAGQFVAQYAVTQAGSPTAYSVALSRELVTSVPDRPSNWIALEIDP